MAQWQHIAWLNPDTDTPLPVQVMGDGFCCLVSSTVVVVVVIVVVASAVTVCIKLQGRIAAGDI
jgi:hypothetical protein